MVLEVFISEGFKVIDTGRYLDLSFEDQSIAISYEQERLLLAWLELRGKELHPISTPQDQR